MTSPADRAVNVRHGFHGFHRTERLALLDLCSHLRQVHIHDVAELCLRMIGDSDRAGVALHQDPLMFPWCIESFSGYIFLFRSFVERSFHCDRIHRLVADHDLNGLADLRLRHREVAQADVSYSASGKAIRS